MLVSSYKATEKDYKDCVDFILSLRKTEIEKFSFKDLEEKSNINKMFFANKLNKTGLLAKLRGKKLIHDCITINGVKYYFFKKPKTKQNTDSSKQKNENNKQLQALITKDGRFIILNDGENHYERAKKEKINLEKETFTVVNVSVEGEIIV